MIKILSFLNLLDESKRSISLTNIALIAIIVKLLISPTVDWGSIVTLATVCANYMHKRSTNSKDSTNDGQSS